MNFESRKENLMRALKLIGGAMLLAAIMVPAVQAQDTADVKRLTILTFSAPVQLPGMTLPAGKYRFEMADINNAAHTVRVLSEDGQKVIGLFPTTPNTIATRDLRDTDSLVMFAERPAGQPQAAKAWYYPQRSIGEEFIYPKAQAVALAAANHTSVASEENGKVVRVEGTETAGSNQTAAQNENTSTPASASASEANTGARAQSQVAETGASAQAQQPAAVPQQTSGSQPTATAGQNRQAVGTSGQSTTPAAGSTTASAPAAGRARTLPRTASQLTLFELLSGLSIAAALGLRQMRNRGMARE